MENRIGIYAIFDKKSKKYDTPFFAASDINAKRRLILMMDEERSPLSKWPEDFALYKVGEFQIDHGDVYDDKELLLEALSVQKGGKE